MTKQMVNKVQPKHESQCDELKRELRTLNVDAFSAIFSKHNGCCLKLFWLLVLIVCACVCFVLIIQSIQEYLKYDVTTNIRVINEQKSEFPVITVCSDNPFSTDYADTLFREANVSNSRTNIYMLQMYVKKTTGTYLSQAQLVNMSNINDFLILCDFSGVACTVKDFETIYHPNYGVCFRYNSGYDANGAKTTTKSVLWPGFISALTLDLYTGLTDSQNYTGSQPFRAFNVFVLNSTTYPYWYGQAPYIVTPGSATTFRLERTFYEQFNTWPYKYSECTVNEENELIRPLDDNELFETVVNTGYHYSRTTCVELCFSKGVVETCNCTTPISEFNRGGALEFCLTSDKTACSNSYQTNTYFDFNYYKTHCLARCPLECHRSELVVSLSTYTYPGSKEIARSLLDGNPTFVSRRAKQSDFVANYAENVLRLRFAYNSLAYTEVKEEPKMTVDSLIGLIGGHLHLFLGMSFMSFVEIFVFFGKTIGFACSCKK